MAPEASGGACGGYHDLITLGYAPAGAMKGLLWGLKELSDKHGCSQVQAKVKIELTKRYKELYPGEECPCLGIMRGTYGGERPYAFSMQIADEDAQDTTKMWRLSLKDMKICGEVVSLQRVTEQKYSAGARTVRQNRFVTDYELEVMVWNVDSSATQGKLQEEVLEVLQETGAPFDTEELAMKEVVSIEVKWGRAVNRLHGIVRLKMKTAVEALLMRKHQVATRLGWSVYLRKSQSPEEQARGHAQKNGYSGVPVLSRGAAQPVQQAGAQPSAHAKTYMEVAAHQGVRAARHTIVGEMVDASADKIAQKAVAGLEDRVRSLETAQETY